MGPIQKAREFEEARQKAQLVLLQTEDEQLRIETASELSSRQKHERLAAGVGSIVTRLNRLCPAFLLKGEEIDLHALYKIREDLERLHLTGGAA